LFRWFVGLNLDEAVWDATTFTKNRERLQEADVAKQFLAAVVELARQKGFVSDDHFTVDGTLLEAWASAKSFQPKEGTNPPPDDPGNPTIDFHGQRRSNETHESQTDPEARLARKSDGVGGERKGRARRSAGHAGAGSRRRAHHSGRGQGFRHEGFCGRVPSHERDAARSAEPWAKRQRHRCAYRAA
jgi:hypothetical protein